jgi:ssDNA-binding replication factor A large subunit
LEPDDANIHLKCKVLSEVSEDHGLRCYLVTVGDATGSIELLLSDSYYNNLVQVLRPGVSLEVSNGFIVMREEKFMALRTAQGGRVALSQQEWDFTPNAENNVSSAEYELAS